MSVFTHFSQSLNNTVSLFRVEMAGDVDGEHIHQSCFSVGYSTRKLGQLCGAAGETREPCVAQTQ